MRLEVGVGQIESDCDVTVDLKPKSKAQILANAEALPFRTKVFDEIKFFEVLEHIRNPLIALSDINRCLNSEGMIRLCIPNVFYLWAVIRWIFRTNVSVHHEHIWGWRISELRNLLRDTGFTIERVMFINHKNALHLTTRLRFLPILNQLTCRSLCVTAKKEN